ncbi:hypothetical protein ABHV46_10975 [Asaia sp. BMEF1]|uniref:hypothetical protein n=1 Tax=Asaia sp. BMEF1 TaxID=3155932 RepID=UPI003F680EFE
MQGNLPDGVTIAGIERSYGFISEDMSEDISNFENARGHLEIAFEYLLAAANNSCTNDHDGALDMIEDKLIPHCKISLRQLGVVDREDA